MTFERTSSLLCIFLFFFFKSHSCKHVVLSDVCLEPGASRDLLVPTDGTSRSLWCGGAQQDLVSNEQQTSNHLKLRRRSFWAGFQVLGEELAHPAVSDDGFDLGVVLLEVGTGVPVWEL